MDKMNVGFYLLVVAVGFVLGSIFGGLVVHYAGKFFRGIQEEMEEKEKVDELEG